MQPAMQWDFVSRVIMKNGKILKSENGGGT
jgi:hypothetical protein